MAPASRKGLLEEISSTGRRRRPACNGPRAAGQVVRVTQRRLQRKRPSIFNASTHAGLEDLAHTRPPPRQSAAEVAACRPGRGRASLMRPRSHGSQRRASTVGRAPSGAFSKTFRGSTRQHQLPSAPGKAFAFLQMTPRLLTMLMSNSFFLDVVFIHRTCLAPQGPLCWGTWHAVGLSRRPAPQEPSIRGFSMERSHLHGARGSL